MCVLCLYSLWTQRKCFAFIFLFPARKHDSGEYLNITGITRDQAGDYECSALNDIASPDTKTVKVTVNCKYISFLLLLLLHFVLPCLACRCMTDTRAAFNKAGVTSPDGAPLEEHRSFWQILRFLNI